MIRPQQLEQEIRRATEAIRRVFMVDSDLDEAGAEQLNRLLTDCVTSVNDRLRHCDELLRRGLREEAIQECRVPPNFLDLVTELDMPEWDAWADYVRQFGIPPQPHLLIDVAADLNQAYAQSQTLQQLLRKHRLHALARSPLSVRLGLLRLISRRDPDNPLWKEDIVSYEETRLRQVNAELQQLAAQRNLRGAAAIAAELQSADWQTLPPKGLIERAVTTHLRLLADDSRIKLRKLVPLIDAAFSSFDVRQAEHLRDEWNSIAPGAQLSDNDDLTASVAQAFEWLDQEESGKLRQQSFNHAVAELEAALDDDSIKQSGLTKLMAAVERFGEAIPERVIRRYDQRTRALEVSDRRHSRLILSSSIFALSLVAAGAALGVWWLQRVHVIRDFVGSLSAAEKSGDYQQALDQFEAQSKEKPYLANDEGVQHEVEVLRQRLQEEKVRAASLDQHVAAALSDIEDANWGNVAAAKDELSQAEHIAKGEGELSRVAEAHRATLRVQEKLQTDVDETFIADMKPINAAMMRFDKMTAADIAETVVRVKSLQQREHVSEATRSAAQLDLVLRKLETRRNFMDENERLESATHEIIQAIGQPGLFRNALQRYVSQATHGRRASDFKRVIDEDLGNDALFETWDKLSRDWAAVKLTDVSSVSEAKRILQVIKDKYARFPGVGPLIAVEPYVESLARRDEARKERDRKLSLPVFAMDVLRRNDGDTLYFFDANAKRVKESTGEAIIIQPLTDSTDTTKVAGNNVHAFVQYVEIGDSPQKAFVTKVTELFTKSYPYEQESCVFLHDLLQERHMDAILQTQLMQVFTDNLATGSSILQDELRPLQDVLAVDQDLAAQNWLDTKSGATAELRATLRAKLDRLMPSDNSPKALYNSRIAPAYDRIVVHKPQLPSPRWVGILMRDDLDQWTCRTNDKISVPANGRLYLFDNRDSNVDPFHVIGEVSDAGFKLEGSDSDFREGRPVFYLSESNGTEEH
jgi:hypothetical protein